MLWPHQSTHPESLENCWAVSTCSTHVAALSIIAYVCQVEVTLIYKDELWSHLHFAPEKYSLSLWALLPHQWKTFGGIHWRELWDLVCWERALYQLLSTTELYCSKFGRIKDNKVILSVAWMLAGWAPQNPFEVLFIFATFFFNWDLIFRLEKNC